MRVRLLGTGDTAGTPKVGCTCPVCTRAARTGMERLRTSLLITRGEANILIDTSPDLRAQLLAAGAPHIDAVIWTHGHYDHFSGFNDFYRVQKYPPVYGAPPVLAYLGKVYNYIRMDPHPVMPYEPFEIAGITFTLGVVTHPPEYTCGVVWEADGVKVGYTADTNRFIPDETKELLSGCDLLFLDALFPPDVNHGKHMNYTEAVAMAEELSANDFRVVHMSHRIGWDWAHIGLDGETFVLGE